MNRLPNLLDSRIGRLAGFFLLYVCEGLPQGYAATAVALEFRRMGMTAEAIGSFAAFIMLPWAWKWAMGPVVDNLRLRRFGRRKQWIVITQLGMMLTLVAALLVFPKAVEAADGLKTFHGLALFSWMLLAHSVCAATQDVAIDALACDTLGEKERGTANGMMFAGAQLGAAIGGSGVLFLKGVLGFSLASLLPPLCLLMVLVLVVMLVREPKAAPIAVGDRMALIDVCRAIAGYLRITLRVFLTTKRGFLSLLCAVIPFGGMALSLTVSTVISPTLGMSDGEIAKLALVTSIVFTLCCMLGGLLSDRFGRRLTLTVFSLGTLLPTLWIGWRLKQEGWITPSGASADGTWPRHEALIQAWWIASVVYVLFQGLMYGIRTAFFMDLIEPRIAATHFTACMALMNLVTIYCYWWQGKAITPAAEGGWGFSYQQIFLLDAVLGGLFVVLLPFVRKRESNT
jgi:PAT family beta-lactamase induction signal transducer AmpG